MNASLTWITPPECGGQIVEYSYASGDEGVMMRIHDHASGEVSTYVADWDAMTGECEPWNGTPDVDDDAWVIVCEEVPR